MATVHGHQAKMSFRTVHKAYGDGKLQFRY